MAFVDHIELLLGQASETGMYYHSALKTVLKPIAYVGTVGAGTYVAQPDDQVSMISEPAALLQKLYAAAHPSERRFLAETLLRLLNRENARVVARTLAATGNVSAVHSIARLGPDVEEFWRGLIHVLRFESPLFSEADLQAVETAAKGLHARAYAEALARMEQAKRDGDALAGHLRVVQGPPGHYRVITPLDNLVEEVISVVSRIRYLRLAKTIGEHQNPAIDADRQILLSRLQVMGFSDKLSNASHEIEQRAATAATGTDVKTVMDLLRTFFEEFTEEACRKVEAKVGKPAPSGPKVSHYAPYRQYLESAGFIGFEESELLQKLYNFLSNQGAHKLGSAPEQLRVAHATVIEWSMLIAGRIKKFVS